MHTNTVLCESISKAFDVESVVYDLDLTVRTGQIVALLGPSGCGKTTTLRLIAGFERLDRGRIEIDNREVANAAGRRPVHLPTEQRRVGMVFQDYAIFPHLTVAGNVGFGLRRHPRLAERVAEMLAFVGLEGQGDKMPHELSGGQQQRVALARALAPEPAVLLMDEPFSNLDAALRSQVRKEVRQLLKKSGTTAIFVTHDQEEALFVGDHIAVMNNGRIEQIGPPEVVYHLPRTRFVAEFIGQADFVPGEVASHGVWTPLGLLPQPVKASLGTRVDVVVRADDITFEPRPEGNGRIVSSQFVGMAYIYEIELQDGSRVHSWQPHDRRLPEGASIQASFCADHPLVLFT